MSFKEDLKESGGDDAGVSFVEEEEDGGTGRHVWSVGQNSRVCRPVGPSDNRYFRNRTEEHGVVVVDVLPLALVVVV